MYDELEDPSRAMAEGKPKPKLPDVSDDAAVINEIQQRRMQFIQNISPDGTEIENPKDRYLYLAALKDTTETAQKRIDSDIKSDNSERDRAVTREVIASLAGMFNGTLGDGQATGTIPIVGSNITGKEINPEILNKNPSAETHNEFMDRMDEEMTLKYAQEID